MPRAAALLGFAAAEALWTRFLPSAARWSLFLSLDWQRRWWEHFGHDRNLLLLPIGDEDAPLGLAPLMEEGTTLRFIGSSDLCDYHDFLVGPDVRSFFHALVDCFDHYPAEHLLLESIPNGSDTRVRLPGLLTAAGWSVVVEQEDVTPSLTLPPSWADLLAGLRKKDRHELRRKLRRLEALGDVRMIASPTGSLDSDIDLFLDLMRESRGEKRDFLTPTREAFFRDMANGAQTAGYLSPRFLEVQGEVVSGAMCFDWAGHRLLYNSGYRLAYGHASVGLLLKALCLREAIEQGLLSFDFLRGAEAYKYHLGALDSPLWRLEARRHPR